MVRKIKDIEVLKENVSEIDHKVLKLLEKRFEISKKIGKCKLEMGLKIQDEKAEKKLITIRCEKTNLPEEFVEDLFTLILNQSKKLQLGLK